MSIISHRTLLSNRGDRISIVDQQLLGHSLQDPPPLVRASNAFTDQVMKQRLDKSHREGSTGFGNVLYSKNRQSLSVSDN